jgi:hypothetical protein
MTNREAIADGANPRDQVAELVMRLDKLGYRGDYSFDVFKVTTISSSRSDG